MKTKLHIDLETYSSVDITKSGIYKYTESVDFEILLLGYAIDDEPVRVVDLANGEKFPKIFLDAYRDPQVEKWAHNAAFERLSFRSYGMDIGAENWRCTQIKAAYCGLVLKLEELSKILELGEKGKKSIGKALINYFCKPVKPTKVNGMRTRNLPRHDRDKWDDFKYVYLVGDVEAEREIEKILSPYEIPENELYLYVIDQLINDRGVLVDVKLAKVAQELDRQHKEYLMQYMKELTGIDNPNSTEQLREWLSTATGTKVDSIAKAKVQEMIDNADENEDEDLIEVLEARKLSSKSSTKKYRTMLECLCEDNRVHGLLQFYGANRTGRWAGRLVQLQNLPQNKSKILGLMRDLVKNLNYQDLKLFEDNVSSILSQLIRTAFIAPPGHTLGVNDFSAIEGRVTAWISDEQWRLDVFKGDGLIYEASASMMFGVPIEECGKGSEYRPKGKVAELALGFGGGVQALVTMGGSEMGLSEFEMDKIKRLWRSKSPNIVEAWSVFERAAIRAIKTKRPVRLPSYKGLIFDCDDTCMTIQLPSGRKLFYWGAQIITGKFGNDAMRYKGMNQKTKKWNWVDTWGGKLMENIVQAIARDLLAFALVNLHEAGFKIIKHIHDEIVTELRIFEAKEKLKEMEKIMSTSPPWALDLPLEADGYTTDFYMKKD